MEVKHVRMIPKVSESVQECKNILTQGSGEDFLWYK